MKELWNIYVGNGLNYLRNICAHHARLWNIELDVNPKKYLNKNPNYIWLSNEEVQSAQTRRLYYSLCLILYLLQSVNPNTKFRAHFKKLLADYPVVQLGYMGFPEVGTNISYGWKIVAKFKNEHYICTYKRGSSYKLEIISLSGASQDSILEGRFLFYSGQALPPLTLLGTLSPARMNSTTNMVSAVNKLSLRSFI